jgi:hypothetical protein
MMQKPGMTPISKKKKTNEATAPQFVRPKYPSPGVNSGAARLV